MGQKHRMFGVGNLQNHAEDCLGEFDGRDICQDGGEAVEVTAWSSSEALINGQ